MASAHSSNRVNRKKGVGRHRAKKRTPEAYAWLDAGRPQVSLLPARH
jgi:hypothetical protein